MANLQIVDSNMKKYIISLVFFTCILSAKSQVQFITQGRVEYEKKMNQHTPLEDEADNIWNVERMKVIPKFVTDIYELKFNASRSIYKLAKENPTNRYMMWGGKPSETDILVTDILNATFSSQKDIFENTYLIKDSVRNLEWKISEETREIAGFECRKAVTKICDSVYVVAFYTDQIPVNGGPESFNGLPGLILGLAIPRLYTTWFATKLELIEPTVVQLNPKQKGKIVNRAQLITELEKGLKDWGKDGVRRIWNANL
ncbi:MAG: GLPGLI family protein [Sphingobacteriia bacterium]|nr:MAG: GLPGLI family protein [Sphingobacteriia bacterium]TAG31916.1 MAG: GLPGLI family protein [Sphingobacteriia bacterium]TAH07876.1 MAG: GLPGLI family protein [Sphingobacteriia bacterium]